MHVDGVFAYNNKSRAIWRESGVNPHYYRLKLRNLNFFQGLARCVQSLAVYTHTHAHIQVEARVDLSVNLLFLLNTPRWQNTRGQLSSGPRVCTIAPAKITISKSSANLSARPAFEVPARSRLIRVKQKLTID